MRPLTAVNRSLSLIVVVGLVALSANPEGSAPESFKTGICVVIPLCLIWFGDQIGSFTGYIGRGGNIDCESPGWLVCAMGWFLLIGVPLILYGVNRG